MRSWLESLRARLWLIPAAFAAAAAFLAWLLVSVDRSLAPDVEGPFFFGGGPESARSILSTIAAAMLTFTGLVFSVTMLVLQLASNQLSPRVTRTFLRDRKNQAVLGVFVATFLYALLVLREVRSTQGAEFVPSIATWVAFALLIASVGAFIFYIDHMAHAMRVSTVIANVADETRAALDRTYPEPVGSAPPPDLPVPKVTSIVPAADRPGTIQGVDLERLTQIARDADAVIELAVVPGDAIPGGGTLARIRGGGSVDPAAVRGAIVIGDERTMDQDPLFGVRQLVDIAARALSPGVNDPTTARLVIDRLHDLLRLLARRAVPADQRVDERGELRLIVPGPNWAAYVTLASEEIRIFGGSTPQIRQGLANMLDDLAEVAPEERREPIRRQREALRRPVDS
ncbi:MAG TPA: DUF2254 domain-containing protein [Candidatus Limnocylindrales bacterium]|nr:DUF2254 domain-containing protein [Candidatus Limnocylindrales bacterium]